jgi:hypothetical protein
MALFAASLPKVALCAQDASGDTIVAEDQAIEFVNVMDAALRRWKEEAQFSATYRFRAGLAVSREDALAARFSNPITLEPHTGETGHGFVSKRSDAFRYSFNPETSYNGTRESSKYGTFDVAVCNGVQALYFPLRLADNGYKSGGKLTFQDISSKDQEGRYPYVERVVPMPLFFAGGLTNHPLLSITPRPGLDERVSWQVEKTDKSHLVLVAHREGVHEGIPWTNKTAHTFRVDVAYPFLERVEDTRSTSGDRDSYEEVIQVSRLVDCDGCLVPSHVVIATELPASGFSVPLRVDSFWRVRTWESDDLGKRAPADSDFVLTAAKGTKVGGLKPEFVGKAEFNLQAMTLDDLSLPPAIPPALSETSVPVSPPAGPGAPAKSRAFSWPFLFVVSIVVGGVLIAWSNRWRGPTRSEPLH